MAAKTVFSFQTVRRALVGAPIPTSRAHHERLSALIGLPVFSSDALSSVAYASEAILAILILRSIDALNYNLWVTAAICALIVIIAISYNQTIHAYPSGGGSYIVASDNLGPKAGLLAGAALLIDYVLTVSVSVAAGVAALVSAYPGLHSMLVPLSLFFIAVVAWANLRGVRESGAMFAVPTYGFIFGVLAMLVVGLIRALHEPTVHQTVLAEPAQIGKEANYLLLFVVLRAFSAGCTALTGIEAVSNGVQAFKSPEAKNAAKTLGMMATLLLIMFLGISFMAQHLPTLNLLPATNPGYRTVVSQVAGFAFGANSLGFYYIQFATAAILILAANTAFADFPRLSSLIARDGYLPRPLARQGDRLVFHNGIMLLAVAAGLLVVKFRGQLDQLLPLYAVGVFTAFTLSQAGMVVHWKRLRTPKWQLSALINGVGALLSAVVLIVILVTKFSEGAWIVAVLLPIIFAAFVAIKARYTSMTAQLELTGKKPHRPSTHTSLLLVPRVHQGILEALEYARMTDPECEAVHVAIDDRRVQEVQERWQEYGQGVPLVVLRSPFRSLIEPLLDYVDELMRENPDQVITVIVPEAVSTKWYQRLLQENVAQQLKSALGVRENVVITNVKYFLR